MSPAASHPVPLNETERLDALDQFRIIGTPRDPAFDEICQIVKEQLDVPIVMISLADRDRHWFKACIGAALSEVPRNTSFCTNTILGEEALIIPDAMADGRFRDHPFVISDPRLRFYAGVPLLLRPGLALGSLCAIDLRPRSIDERQITLLKRMSHIVVEQLKHHKARLELADELAARRKHAERMKSQRATLNRHRRFTERSARMAGAGGWVYEVAAQNLVWSREIHRIAETSQEDRLRPIDVIEMISPVQRPAIRRLIRNALRHNRSFEAELDIVTGKGSKRRVAVICEPEWINGRAVRLAGSIRDVTGDDEVRKKAQLLGKMDPLTQLPNRAAFEEVFEKTLEEVRQRGTRGALLLVDLDHFKAVNDTLGHKAGDAILKAFSERFRSKIRDRDFVARLGGDEFAVVLREINGSRGVKRVAQAVVAMGSSPFHYGDQAINLGVSIGVRLFSDRVSDPDKILQEADIALYRAKARGRNCCVTFKQHMRAKLEEQQRTLAQVRNSLQSGQFTVHFLPQIDLRTGRYSGLEALLRWKHPEAGILRPARFAAALADFALSRDLSNFALTTAVEQMSTWRTQGIDFGFVAVNVAYGQIAERGFAEKVVQMLYRHALKPEMLTLEVVEAAVLNQDNQSVIKELQDLMDAGVTISLDDFGTGYASLVHLRKFPIKQLKIDRSVTNEIDRDITSLSVTRSIIELARVLNLRTVAEGVERTAVADILRKCGCDEAQGFLWNNTLSAEEAGALFAGRGKIGKQARFADS